jgi:hypothetical protein
MDSSIDIRTYKMVALLTAFGSSKHHLRLRFVGCVKEVKPNIVMATGGFIDVFAFYRNLRSNS